MEPDDKTQPLVGFAAILAAMEAQRAALDEAIAKMRAVAGVGDAGGTAALNAFSQPVGLIAPGEVPLGAFHGKSIPEAAVLYLRMVKQKQKVAAIATALRRGGIESRAADYNSRIHSLLDRASKRSDSELIKMHDAYWGLREWLPANIRASIGPGQAPRKPRHGSQPRKTPRGAKQSRKNTTTTLGVPAAPTTADEPSQSAPPPQSAEGKILTLLQKHPAKEWTGKEIAAHVGIERSQTAALLLGKLAFNNFIKKVGEGTYRLN